MQLLDNLLTTEVSSTRPLLRKEKKLSCTDLSRKLFLDLEATASTSCLSLLFFLLQEGCRLWEAQRILHRKAGGLRHPLSLVVSYLGVIFGLIFETPGLFRCVLGLMVGLWRSYSDLGFVLWVNSAMKILRAEALSLLFPFLLDLCGMVRHL